MAFDTYDVLKYLSKQGFRVNMPSMDTNLSLIEWNNWKLNKNAFGLETGDKTRELIVRPVYENLRGEYKWVPSIRQLFSQLEVTAGDKGSFTITSPKPIFFEPVRDMEGSDFNYSYSLESFYRIRLLRTVRD